MSSMTPEQYIASIPATFHAADRERSATLNEAQRALAIKIFRRFIEAGYPTRVAIAAVVNSYAESRLRADLVATESDGRKSVGLFQLYDGGAGAGMTIAERQDPETNISRLLEAERHALGANVTDATSTPAEATWAFCYYVERPSEKRWKSDLRARMCAAMFPRFYNAGPDRLPAVDMSSRASQPGGVKEPLSEASPVRTTAGGVWWLPLLALFLVV